MPHRTPRSATSTWHVALCALCLGGALATTAGAQPAPRLLEAKPASKTRCALPRAPNAADSAPNIILIAVDTLRADHLGFLGHSRDVSPSLDALANDSLIFERAIAAAPWTTPSFAGLFTGRHPAELGFEKEPIRLPAEIPTLGEQLDERGYTTVGVISHFFLGKKFGFHRGFDFWNQNAAGGHDKVSSEEVTDLALDCLTNLADRGAPFFLFVHYFDPHYDYLGHPEHPYYGHYDGPVRSEGDNFEDLRKMARADRLSPADMRYLRDLYDSEIAFTDQHIGRLLDGLRAADLYDDAIIVFLADHGEMFAERQGRWIGHTQFLYDEVVRVPLVVKLPHGDGRRGRIRQAVSLVDVGPTVLEWIDGAQPSPRSLIVSASKGRPVFTQTRRWRQLDAVVHDGWKLIADRRRGFVELFDLARDPGERENRADTEPERRDELQELLDAWAHFNTRELAKLEGVEVPEMTDEEMERLRSLGYIQ